MHCQGVEGEGSCAHHRSLGAALSYRSLSPQASTVDIHSSGVKSTPCPLVSGLRDVALRWLYWPALSRNTQLPLSNSFAAEATAGGRKRGENSPLPLLLIGLCWNTATVLHLS